MRIRVRLPALIVALVSLQGCGGGGNNAPAPPPPTYTVGGAVSGLAGSGLVLTLNGGGDLVISATGNFSFPAALTNGSAYLVAVKTQPITPYQTCAVTNGSGIIAGSAIANVSVACTTNNYSVSGSVAGLAASGLVLRLNGTLDLAVSANGAFTFPGPLASGSNYEVTIGTQPNGPAQTCVATNGTGVIGGSDTNVTVNCTTNGFSVGGAVTGLTGTGLVLRNNFSDQVSVAVNGAFVFPAKLTPGSEYEVDLAAFPDQPLQRCTVTDGSGTVGAANVTNIQVTCTEVHSRSLVVGAFVLGSPKPAVFNLEMDEPTGTFRARSYLLSSKGHEFVSVSTASHRFVYAGDSTVPGVAAFEVLAKSGLITEVPANASTLLPGVIRILVVHPSQRFLYCIEAGTPNLLHAWSIDQVTGVLTEVGTAIPVGVATKVEIHPSGTLLYVTALDDPTLAVGFRIDETSGVLTGLPVVVPPATQMFFLNSRVTHLSGATPGSTVPYEVEPSTGALTAVGMATSFVPFWYQPNNTFVYSYGLQGLRGYALDSRGRVVGSPLPLVNRYCRPDPTGKYCFASTFNTSVPGAHTLESYRIDPVTSAMQLVSSGLLPRPGDSELNWQITVDPGGRQIYANTLGPGSTDRTQVLNVDRSTGGLSVEPNATLGLRWFTKASFTASAPARFKSRFAYVVNAADETVSAFEIDASTGALTGVASPVGTGAAPLAAAIDRGNRYLLVANGGDASISVYRINPDTGVLAAVAGSPFASVDAPVSIAVDMSSRFVYVTSAADGSVSMQPLDSATGILGAASGRISVPTDPASFIAIHPTARTAYSANANSGSLSIYDLNFIDGSINAPQQILEAGNSPAAIAVSPTSGDVYVANAASNDVSYYSGLPARIAAGTEPRDLVADPTGRFLFVANRASHDISAYRIGSGSPPVPVPGSPFATDVNPRALAVDYSGHFIYVAHQGSSSIRTFAINANGALSSTGLSVATGAGPVAIVLTNESE